MRKFIALAGLLLFYSALVAAAMHRHLWHDELYTYYMAQAPSFTELWKDLNLDLNPPLIYLAGRASMHLFGNTALGVRLPSIVAFFVGSLCLYSLVERRLKPSYGILAVLIFWSTPAFDFATEARPYALILGFFGLAIVSWQRCIERPPRHWPVFLLAVAVSGMMISHLLAILFLIPFLLAEAFRSIRSRRIDGPVAAALLVPCSLSLLFLRTIAAYQSGNAFPHPLEAGPRKMASYYYRTLSPEGWVLLVAFSAALMVCLIDRRPSAAPAKYADFELAFVAGLLTMPIIVNAAMMLSHGAFFTRYSAPTLFAYPLVLVALLAAFTQTNRLGALVMGALMALYIPVQYFVNPFLPPPSFAQAHPELPLVAASGLTFLEMDHEQPTETVQRLYYLTDRQYALQYAHATIFEGLPTIKQRLPIRGHVEPFRDFVRAHHRFLVIGTVDYDEDWLLRYLLSIHAKLELAGEFPSQSKDTQLFVVDMPLQNLHNE
jgi:4-amino-4-deoxy-L-arabinose transferase-like glycosyltransferase